MNLENERSLFETWFCKNHTGLKPSELIKFRTNNGYSFKDSIKINCMWESWLASANRQGYKLVPLEPTYEMWSGLSRHLGRYMQSHDRYCPKTLKKYFDRFIGEPPEWLTKEVKDWDSEHAFATADLPVFIYKSMIEACNN